MMMMLMMITTMMMVMMITFINHDPDHDDSDEAMTAETIRIRCFSIGFKHIRNFYVFSRNGILNGIAATSTFRKRQEDEQNAKATAPQTYHRFC